MDLPWNLMLPMQSVKESIFNCVLIISLQWIQAYSGEVLRLSHNLTKPRLTRSARC